MEQLTAEHLVVSGGSLIATGVAAWAIRTLYATAQVVAVMQREISRHSLQHDDHEERGIDHERRISRIEGAVRAPA